MDTEHPLPLERACRAVNGTSRLASLLKVSKASVSRWKKDGIPAAICPDIEAHTGVPCEELRPDVNWSVLRVEKARG